LINAAANMASTSPAPIQTSLDVVRPRPRLLAIAPWPRHLWRMCAGLFIACGSFFIGQQQVMPRFVQGSPVLFVLGVAPIFFMIFWLFRVYLAKPYKAQPIVA
ncbi:MAG TPA: hypothetical protein VGF50_12500, partial [Caulobacteraceae bacterium]